MKEIIASYSDAKRANERFDFWLYNVGRRLSWPVAWAAINLGVTATGVTFVSAAFVWTGAALIMGAPYRWQIVGTLLFQLWIIFDCADGTVARATKSGSKRGEYADAFGGYSVSLLLYTAMGVAAAREVLGLSSLVGVFRGGGVDAVAIAATAAVPSAAVASAGAVIPLTPGAAAIAAAFLLAGAGGSLFSLYARLLYQKYLNVFEPTERAAQPIKPRDDRSNPVMIAAQNVAANSGLALPASVVAVVFGWARWFALFYLAVNFAMLLLTVTRTLARKPTIEVTAAGPGSAAAQQTASGNDDGGTGQSGGDTNQPDGSAR